VILLQTIVTWEIEFLFSSDGGNSEKSEQQPENSDVYKETFFIARSSDVREQKMLSSLLSPLILLRNQKKLMVTQSQYWVQYQQVCWPKIGNAQLYLPLPAKSNGHEKVVPQRSVISWTASFVIFFRWFGHHLWLLQVEIYSSHVQSYLAVNKLVITWSFSFFPINGPWRPNKAQPRPQGLLAFQYGGGSGEDPGTQQITCLQRGWRCIQNGGYGDKGEKNWVRDAKVKINKMAEKAEVQFKKK